MEEMNDVVWNLLLSIRFLASLQSTSQLPRYMRLFDLLTLLLPLLLFVVVRLVLVLPPVLTTSPIVADPQHEQEHFWGEPRVYSVRTDKLDIIYYWAALMALIKAKAERVLAELNYPAESAVYRQCSEAAKTPAAQAKCTRRLLDLRDRRSVEDNRRYRAQASSFGRDEAKASKPAVALFNAEEHAYGARQKDYVEDEDESGRAGSADWWSWMIDNLMFVRPQFFGRLASELWARNHSTTATEMLLLQGNSSIVLYTSASSDDPQRKANSSAMALENNCTTEEAVNARKADKAFSTATLLEETSKIRMAAKSSAKAHETASARTDYVERGRPKSATEADFSEIDDASEFKAEKFADERTNASILPEMNVAAADDIRPEELPRTPENKVGIECGKVRRKFETFQRVFAAKQRWKDDEMVTTRQRRLLRALGQLRKRTKRKVLDGEASSKRGGETLTNAKRLRELHDFYKNLRFCTTYMQRIANSNSRLVELVLRNTESVRFLMARLRRSVAVDEAERRIGAYLVNNLPILSPKLFSIFPEFSDIRPAKRRADNEPAINEYDASAKEDPALSSGLLSPTLFSFYDEGAFSLPSLFSLTLPRREKEAWLDLLLEMSGAGRILNDFLSGMAPKIAMIHERILPAIRQLDAARRQHNALMEQQTRAQREQLERHGYAVVAAEQWRQIGNVPSGDDFEALTNEEVDRLIEADIRHFATLDDLAPNGQLEMPEGGNSTVGIFERLVNEFSRRVNVNATATRPLRVKRTLKTEKLGQVRVMNPYFFRMQISDGVVFRRVILSPKAFGLSLLTTDFFRINVLSPSAFIPAILSPHSLVGNVLSPSAFGGNLLSPIAGAFEVLSPHAFVMQILSPIAAATSVLSPKLFSAEVLSPKTLTVDIGGGVVGGMFVLSPGLLQTSLRASSYYTLKVLSPSILNANFLGGGEMNVKILSPMILSTG